MVTAATWPSPDSWTLTAIRSAEGNDEERLPVLDRRPACHEHLADLAIRGRADLGDVTEGLDPAENVTTRDRVARAPLARDAEDTDGRRVNALGLFGRSFLMAFRERVGPFGLSLPRDRDREAVRFDFDRDGGETLGQLELEQVVHEAEERIVRVAHRLARASRGSLLTRAHERRLYVRSTYRPPFSSGFFRMRLHQGCAGAGAAPPSGSTNMPKERKRS